MTAEQWERIKTIFEAALNVPEDQRDAYLDSACGDDPELGRTVAGLLRNHFSAANFLQESSADVAPVFAAGELVADRFRITRFINRGGMGEVFEAYDERLQVRLALKTLRPEFLADREALDRFRREIRVAREVSHPNLCRVFDLIEHRGVQGESALPCLTMQLLDGESLLPYLLRCAPLTEGQALPLIREIGGALAALHERGIVHRDLKPSNIMLMPAPDGSLKAMLMDFGLAKMCDGDRDFFESALAMNAGAPYYIAPELLRGEAPSAASDIYAFGLVIDEMVTESRAFPADSVPSLMYQKLWQRPIPPSARGLRAPPPWETAILRCLLNDPRARYAGVAELMAVLEGDAASKTDETLAALHRLVQWRPSRRTVVALGSSAALGLAAMTLPRLLVGKPASVLVFEIANETNRPDLDYLCRGTTRELTRRLGQVEGVRVVPYYDRRPKKLPREAETRFALDGIMQAFQGKVRLSIQLTEARDGSLIWSRDFDRQLDDPLELQSDIAEGTVQAIERRILFDSRGADAIALMASTPMRKLFGFQSGIVSKPPTTSSAAFGLFLRGYQLYSEMTAASGLAAMDLFQRAVAEDSGFALAYAAMADTQIVLMDYNHAPFPELLSRAYNLAERSVILGSDLAETHTTLAAMQQMSWEWRAAERSYREAMRLNPRYSRAHRYFGGMLMQFARSDESLRWARRALELDPFDYPSQHAYGLLLFFAERHREAVTQANYIIARKEYVFSHFLMGNSYARLAQLSSGTESAEWFRKAFEQAAIAAAIERKNAGRPLRFSDRMYAHYYALTGDRQAAQPYLSRMTEDMAAGILSPAHVAVVLTALGDTARAIDLLEDAARQKDRGLMYLRVQPFFEPLRRIDRFQSVIKQMNLQSA